MEKEIIDGAPVRSIGKKLDMTAFDETEDCLILEFDPFDITDIKNLTVSTDPSDTEELYVTAEKGQVACRDYPHPRHLCLKFPFRSTSHESHCNMCYCYVCDLAAPCLSWSKSQAGHCDASEHNEKWKLQRNIIKMKQKSIAPQSHNPNNHTAENIQVHKPNYEELESLIEKLTKKLEAREQTRDMYVVQTVPPHCEYYGEMHLNEDFPSDIENVRYKKSIADKLDKLFDVNNESWTRLKSLQTQVSQLTTRVSQLMRQQVTLPNRIETNHRQRLQWQRFQ